MLGTRRASWFEGLSHQLAGQSAQSGSEPVERLDPSDLAARIGAAPKTDAAAAPDAVPAPHNDRSDGIAPWRKALRDR